MPRGGRKTGSKNRRTVEREKAKKIAALRAEIWKNAPPIDFKAPLDSLEIMEGVMRHFYFRALIEERMGPQAEGRNEPDASLRTRFGRFELGDGMSPTPRCEPASSASNSCR